MRMRATIVVEYDVDDDTLDQAYGTADPAAVVEVEKGFIDSDGDYFLFAMSEAVSITTTVEHVPTPDTEEGI